ncbi:MAG: tetratricopeptide repeat protein [Candidatus Obscuribacterales bacterium]|nr:tetratricopeptide repeat protein [Candidatus Obscuribacterales bacterium]
MILFLSFCLGAFSPASAAEHAKSGPSNAGEPKAAGKSAADASKTEAAKSAEEDEKSWKELLESASRFYEQGKLNEASEAMEAALGAAERLRADGSRSNAFFKLAEQYLYLKQYERAKTLIQEGLSLQRKIPGFKNIANANVLDNLAQAYARSGEPLEASKFEKEALSIYESLHKTETHDYAIALSNHANTLRQLKEYKDSEQFFAKAVAVEQKVDGKDSLELAKILLNAGGLYCEMDKLDSAKRLLDRAEKIIQSKLSPSHPLYLLSIKSERVMYKKRLDALLKNDSNAIRPEVASVVLRLAALYENEGDLAQSVAAYKQALGIEEQLLAPDSPELQKIKDAYLAALKKFSN